MTNTLTTFSKKAGTRDEGDTQTNTQLKNLHDDQYSSGYMRSLDADLNLKEKMQKTRP